MHLSGCAHVFFSMNKLMSHLKHWSFQRKILLGSLAFLGVADLELRGMRLIERVHAQGIALSAPQLEAFQADLHTYLTYLGSL